LYNRPEVTAVPRDLDPPHKIIIITENKTVGERVFHPGCKHCIRGAADKRRDTEREEKTHTHREERQKREHRERDHRTDKRRDQRTAPRHDIRGS
jgi:hypothetical protein